MLLTLEVVCKTFEILAKKRYGEMLLCVYFLHDLEIDISE